MNLDKCWVVTTKDQAFFIGYKHPKFGFVFVFTTRAQARKLCRGLRGYRVMKAKVIVEESVRKSPGDDLK